MDLGFADAVVVVNRGTKGMGRAAAETVAAEGAKVALLARGEQGLNDTAARPDRTRRPRCPADSHRPQQPNRYRRSIRDHRRTLGRGEHTGQRRRSHRRRHRPLESIDDDNWHATFDIGTLSAVKCVEAALPLLRKGRVGAHRECIRAFGASSVPHPDRSPPPRPRSPASARISRRPWHPRGSWSARSPPVRSCPRACVTTSHACPTTAAPTSMTCTR